jgi:hypothetical protein
MKNYYWKRNNHHIWSFDEEEAAAVELGAFQVFRDNTIGRRHCNSVRFFEIAMIYIGKDRHEKTWKRVDEAIATNVAHILLLRPSFVVFHLEGCSSDMRDDNGILTRWH